MRYILILILVLFASFPILLNNPLDTEVEKEVTTQIKTETILSPTGFPVSDDQLLPKSIVKIAEIQENIEVEPQDRDPFDLIDLKIAYKEYIGMNKKDERNSQSTEMPKQEKNEVEQVSKTSSKNSKNYSPLNVPIIPQNPELPRGCEVTSLAMMLNYAGISVDKMTLAEQLKKVPFKVNGIYGNPNEGFVGSMYSFNEHGLGVYNGPIFDLASEYMPDEVINLTGLSFDEVLDYLKNKTPIWVIANTSYTWLPDHFWETWKVADGKIKVTYKEHSVLITGYDGTYVYFNDPLEVISNRRVLKNEFEKAFNQMGKQAITYNPIAPIVVETSKDNSATN